ncbi:MAG TPA: glycerol-3-phosphate dehydrogenase/oxidase [Cytophagales bacterium]|nr:glycerol-3-phosphate dehydrogenase/oxidase [Cytophagales bacterium]
MAYEREGNLFKRELSLEILKKEVRWDIIVIGGGATGLGTALDAASRGFKVLLLEQSDFAKGTSSRSTKLIHGGVRYLAQGNIRLVYDALKERGRLLQNAPHLIKKLEFIIPCYDWFSIIKYFAGLKIYDWLSGKWSFGDSEYLSTSQVLNSLPAIRSKGLKGGIKYYDGQFDDARLAIALAKTASEKGATLLNYFKVTGLSKKENGIVDGVLAIDTESQKEYHLHSKVVVNATGVFVDEVLKMDDFAKPLVRPSQGTHIVLDRSFLKSTTALMIPKTPDGRVLFVVPWNNHLLLGTTDTPLNESDLEPRPLDSEIDFIIKTAGQYLGRPPERKDILSIFAGLRPLAAPKENTNSTKEISRDHKLITSVSRLITITGGKWTTYRKMAEETVDKAIKVGNLSPSECITKDLKIDFDPLGFNAIYQMSLGKIIEQNPELGNKLHERFPFVKAKVIWAVRNEMARTVEDILARRLRVLFLDARAAIEMAPVVASLMAKELRLNQDWESAQIEKFVGLANQYLPRVAGNGRIFLPVSN